MKDKDQIQLIRKDTLSILRLLIIGGIVTLLLTWTYFSNPIDRQNTQFVGYEAVSEALVVGPIAAQQAGYFSSDEDYGLGYYHENTGDTTSYWMDTWSLYRGETGFLTEGDYTDGYSASGNQIVVSANSYTRKYYVPGNKLVFADGGEGVIQKTEEINDLLYVNVDSAVMLSSGQNGNLQDVRLYDASGAELPRGSFSEYPSQIGLQGRVYRNLAQLFPYRSAVTWLRLLTAFAMAVVIVLILYQIKQKYNLLMAVIFGLVFWLSAWIVQFARNLYWVEFTWFLPMFFGLWCSNHLENRKVQVLGCLGVAVSVFLKAACGYEYITTVMMGSILFLLADAAAAWLGSRDRKQLRNVCRCILIVGISALAGFLIAICIHAWIRADGHIFEGIRSIYEKNVLERTWGGNPADFPESERASLEASVFTVLNMYFEFPTRLTVGVSGNLFGALAILPLLLFAWDMLRKKPDYREMGLYLFTFLTSISWFVLGKAHSYIHTHMNFVMWYFGFIQLLFYIPIRHIIDAWKQRTGK